MRSVVLAPLLALAFAGGGLGAVAPGAHAATVGVTVQRFEGYKGSESSSAHVDFRAAPGERNDVTATATGDDVVIRDAGAELAAGAGCTQVDERSVTCTAFADSIWATINAGDGDDSVRLVTEGGSGVELHADGEDGADRLWGRSLSGGAGDDVLTETDGRGGLLRGGSGADAIAGGTGPDWIVGDDGRDQPAPDRLDGGGGRDSVSYEGRTQAVDVDLERVGAQGSAGENDELRNIEGAIGGGGSDRLAGTDGPSHLAGEGGPRHTQPGAHDVLIGRGGPDQIEGGRATSELLGGPGDDLLEAGSGAADIRGGSGNDALTAGRGPDRLWGGAGDDGIDLHSTSNVLAALIDCGSGDDLVGNSLLHHDVIPRGCESVQLEGPEVSTRFRRVDASTLATEIFDDVQRRYDLPCRWGVDLFGPFGPHARSAPLLGSARVRARMRRHQRLRVHLTARGQRLLHARRRLRVLVVLGREQTCHGPARPAIHGVPGFTLVLRDGSL